MAYLGRQPVIGNFVKLDSITVVNGQAAYTMQNGGVNFTSYDNVNQFLVSLNGVLQAPTDSFTVSGSTLTFASNLSTGDVIDFVLVLGNSLDIGTPSDNTVSLAKLTATGTKSSSTFLRGDNTFAEVVSGSLVKLGATTVSSNVANVDFTTQFTSDYSVYKIILQGVRPDTDNNAIAFRFGTGSTFDTTNGNYEENVFANDIADSNDTVFYRGGTGSNISLNPASSQSSGAETSTNAEITIYNMRDSAKNTYAVITGAFEGADDSFRMLYGCYNYNQTNLRDSVRFFNTSANNIATGTFTVYGVIT